MQVSSGRASKPDRAGSKVTRRGQTPVIPDDPVKYAGGPNNLLKTFEEYVSNALLILRSALGFSLKSYMGRIQDISLTHFVMLFFSVS